MRDKKNREWALEFTALPMAIALDGNGFGRAQAQVSVIADPEGGLGLPAMWVNRYIGTMSVTVTQRTEPPAVGIWGCLAVGLLRSNYHGSESFNLTDVDLMADEDIDQPWLWRDFRSIYVRDTRNGIVDPALQLSPLCFDHALVANIQALQLGIAGGASFDVQTAVWLESTAWRIDWPIRGGRGTRLEHDAGVSLHAAFVSYLPTGSNIHYTGEDWLITVATAGTFLFTTV